MAPVPAHRRALFVLTSHGVIGHTGKPTGFHATETAYPWLELREAGFEIDFASPRGGRPPITGLDPDEPVQNTFLGDLRVAARLIDTRTPDQVCANDYAAVYFTGGHGPMWDLRGHHGFQDIARTVYENGGIIGAMCHGPAALVDLRLSDGTYLVEGKRVTSFPDSHEAARGFGDAMPFSLQRTLEERGAHYSHAGDRQAHVVVDGRLVTGQNPASAPELGERISELLLVGAR